MINQVLHHLSGSSDFQQYRQCLAEVFRVLKSRGVLCINTCSQEHLNPEGPFWYLQVFPEAARYMALKYAPIGDLLGILRSAGFTRPVVQTHPDECFFAKEQYFDVEGPFRKEWRDGDSAFAIYRDQGEMLATRLGELKRKILDHSISEIIEKSERIRKSDGPIRSDFCPATLMQKELGINNLYFSLSPRETVPTIAASPGFPLNEELMTWRLRAERAAARLRAESGTTQKGL